MLFIDASTKLFITVFDFSNTEWMMILLNSRIVLASSSYLVLFLMT